MLAEQSIIATALENAGLRTTEIPAALAHAKQIRESLLSDAGQAEALKTMIGRVEISPNGLRIGVSLAPLAPATAAPLTDQGCILTREYPLRVKRRGVEMRLVIEGPGDNATGRDPVLLKEIKRAHRCFDSLVSGRVRSLAELAGIEGVSDRYVSSLLPLAFLAPDIVDAIIRGNHPPELTAHRLIRQLDLPTDWTAQKHLLGFA